MTSALQERTGVDPAADLHASLDRASSLDLSDLSAQGHAALLASLARAKARLAAIEMRVLASADRARVATSTGAANTGQWAAQIARTDQVVAQRQIKLARGLEHRTATQRALSEGLISAEHAAVIVHADKQLPAGLDGPARAQVETALLTKAEILSPGALRKAARRALAAVEDDVAVVDTHENEIVRDLEEHARTKTRLTLHDNNDGTVTGHFTIPVMQGHLLRKVLETITAPRRGRLGATHAQVGDRGARMDWDRARGEAFCELLEHLPTDHLHPKTAATLVVSLELETLRETLKVAHLDTGESLSAGEVRRLACNARLLPAVLNGASLPLDLGRSARLFTEHQRTALGIRHQTCAADGCERPYAWCELHHQQAWSHGGKTDLADAIPLCHFHHQRIHDRGFHHTRGPAGGVIFHRRR